jgi:hypothetical protein
MGEFLESEKPKQAQFKASSPYFSATARSEGVYKGKPRAFCLPIEFAEQNLAPEVREAALSHFAEHAIKWHDGQNGKPSNHLCDSQVCCVNFLFPFADQPRALAEVLRPIFPAIQKMLPVENEQFVTFEWIGKDDYLGETVNARNKKRSRGANCTSADAAVKFERADGKQQVVLIEWKYTESYSGTSLKFAQSGRDRTTIYKSLFERADCPINKELLPNFDSLFYEPFYQFMRQQLLAHEMERVQELSASAVSVLHIAPARNIDFRKVTSPKLETLGETATEVWKKLVRSRGKFISVSTEQLFGSLSVEQMPEMRAWLEYIGARYAWVRASTAMASQ